MRAERATRFILVVSGGHVAAGRCANRRRAKLRVVRVASQPHVDRIVEPGTTNIKLVARRGEICNDIAAELQGGAFRPANSARVFLRTARNRAPTGSLPAGLQKYHSRIPRICRRSPP